MGVLGGVVSVCGGVAVFPCVFLASQMCWMSRSVDPIESQQGAL